MCKKNVTVLLKKWTSIACFMIMLCSYASCSHAAPEHSFYDSSSTSNKPVRKGTLGFIGTQSEVHRFRRQFIVYDTYEMMGHPNETRFATPEEAGLIPHDYSSVPFPIGVKYQRSSKDKNPAVLQSRKFRYVAQYQVEVQVAGQDIRDRIYGNPIATAAVEWNGMDSNTSYIKQSLGAQSGDIQVDLGVFGIKKIPVIVFHTPKMLDTGFITKGEVFENQNPFNEPDPKIIPIDESLEKQISCSATIAVNGGGYSHADALAQLEVFVVPAGGIGNISQYSVKEAFVYPGAIR